jgi:hypothetical protein
MSQKSPGLAWHSPQFYRQAHAVAASRVRFKPYKGKKILIVDFSRADLEMVKAVAAECLQVMSSEPPFSVLSFCDVEAIPFDTDSLRVGGELIDMCKPYSARIAVAGVTGFRAFLLQTIADAAGRPTKLFKDRTAALDWLVGDEDGNPTRG